jgi:hypothetical protein
MAINICISCKTEEGPTRKGAQYEAKANTGFTVKFWLCNKCAIPLGPPQGPIDLDPPGGQQDKKKQ